MCVVYMVCGCGVCGMYVCDEYTSIEVQVVVHRYTLLYTRVPNTHTQAGPLSVSVIEGPIVTEVHQTFNDWVTLCYR